MIAAACQLRELFLRKYYFILFIPHTRGFFVCGYIENFGSNIINRLIHNKLNTIQNAKK